MRAVVGSSLDSLEAYALEDRPVPMPRAGEVLVRVVACGIGYVDSLVALGKYQIKPPTPYSRPGNCRPRRPGG